MKTKECKDHRLQAETLAKDKYRFLFHFCFSFITIFLQCVSKLFLVSTCLAGLCFRITDKLLSFDLYLLFILICLCLNLCIL